MPVISIEGPQTGAPALLWFRAGTSAGARLRTAEGGEAFVVVKSESVGATHLSCVAERSAGIDVNFVPPPAASTLLEQLAKTPRVRVWVGEVALEAWRDARRNIPVDQAVPEVRVDLGAKDARARVTVWAAGKQRSSPGLSAEKVERVIAAALPAASRIELDADNFGRIEIIPTRGAVERPGASAPSDRLAWFHHLLSMCAPPGRSAIIVLERPRASRSLTVRRVGAAGLVRGRQTLRRSHGLGGDR
jgi:hypothetical protein